MLVPKSITNLMYSNSAFISMENFVAVSVEGAGMEAGQRVLELTTPLALAGMLAMPNTDCLVEILTSSSSLFFITTYYSDYILVPAKAKGHVVRALESRGFAFEESSETYVNPHLSTASSMGSGSPTVPPATTLTELQDRTSALLSRHNIRPMVDPNTRLIQCGGRNSNPETFVSDELALQHGITKSLIYRPGFFSLTLTQKESSGLLLEKRLMANFDVDGSENVLLGANEDYLIPIALNLQSLPIEASGIVCGVAGRLVDGPLRAIEMAYLSTAKAGIVMVEEQDLEHAMEALKLGANREIHE